MSKEKLSKENLYFLKISQSIIANQVAYNFLHEIQFTPFYKQRLKNLLGQVNQELMKHEKELYDKIDELKENENVYYSASELVNRLSGLTMDKFPDIINMLEAYKKSPESINGIVNKVLK